MGAILPPAGLLAGAGAQFAIRRGQPHPREEDEVSGCLSTTEKAERSARLCQWLQIKKNEAKGFRARRTCFFSSPLPLFLLLVRCFHSSSSSSSGSSFSLSDCLSLPLPLGVTGLEKSARTHTPARDERRGPSRACSFFLCLSLLCLSLLCLSLGTLDQRSRSSSLLSLFSVLSRLAPPFSFLFFFQILHSGFRLCYRLHS